MRNVTELIYVDGELQHQYEGELALASYASLLRAKYINHVKWVKRINEVCNYDGTYTTTIYQDNGVKNVFTYKN